MKRRFTCALMSTFGLVLALKAHADVRGQGSSGACTDAFGSGAQAGVCTTYQAAYRSVVGREIAGAGLKAQVLAWKGPQGYAEMRAQLCASLSTPGEGPSDGDDSLRGLGVRNAYLDVLGRGPSASEIAYWAPKAGCYDELLAANAAWLAGAPQKERDDVTNRAYRFVFGRDAGEGELSYWRGGFGKVGRGACGAGNVRGYADLVCVNTEWAASPAGAEELKATIARALVAASAPIDPAQVGKWAARYASDKPRYLAGGFPLLRVDVKTPILDVPKGVPSPAGRPSGRP